MNAVVISGGMFSVFPNMARHSEGLTHSFSHDSPMRSVCRLILFPDGTFRVQATVEGPAISVSSDWSKLLTWSGEVLGMQISQVNK